MNTDPKKPNDDPLLGNSPSGLLGAAMETVQPDSQAVPDNWEPPSPEHIAVLLPQYRIEHLIGRGGMGAVYKGRQITLNRPVAIKVLPAELARNREFVARFHREAQLLASLSHQGIVTIFDFGQTAEGHLYFVMEFVDGTDLHRVIHKSKLEADQALKLTVQICEALQYAHDMGVIHRDIKPANVLVTRDGRAKLADFGLALKPADHAAEAPTPLMPDDFDPRDPMGIKALRITKPGTAMGTPDYAAPEVYDGKADARSDIYALGIMLYEMLTGAPPKGYYPLPSSKAKVDVRIDRIVVKALDPDPKARYQKASDMRLAVENATKPLLAKAPAPPKSVPGKPPPGRSQSGVPVGVPALAGKPGAPARQISAPPQQKRRSSQSSTATFMIGTLLLLGVAVAYDADRGWVMMRSLLSSLGLAPERKTIQRIEGEELSIVSASGGTAEPKTDVGSFKSAVWSGGSHLLWRNAKQDDLLSLQFPVLESGRQRVKAVFSCSFDFAIVEIRVDGIPVAGSPFDFQAEEPTVSDILDLGVFNLDKGSREMSLRLLGTHGRDGVGNGAFVVGLDYLQLEPPVRSVSPVSAGTDLALIARPSASSCFAGDHVKNMITVKEMLNRKSSDQSLPRHTWHPRKGGMEWVQYEWETPQAINECQVFWYDDRGEPRGECTLPAFWRLLYREESGAWVPVDAVIPTAEDDKWSVVKFPAVKTTALRISAQCKEGSSAGICHWKAIAADPESVTDPKQRAHPDLFLGDLTPLHSHVGDGIFHANYVDGARKDGGSSITVGTKTCDQFLWAHAESRLEFSIPSGYTRFKATGVTSDPKTWFVGSWKYMVQVDGKTVFESKEMNTYADKQLPMDVVLPPGSKRLTLITDPCSDRRWDWAYWAYPTLIADGSVTAETTLESDSKQASNSLNSQSVGGINQSKSSSSPVPGIATNSESPPIEPGFVTLLDKEHKSGWKQAGPGGMKEELGVFTAWCPEAFGLHWYAERTFSDFILRFDFAVDNMGTNSGVFLRLPKLSADQPPIGFSECYEIELMGEESGSFIQATPPKPNPPPPVKPGDWNACEISVIGQNYVVTINGQQITKFTGNRNTSGYIGLQNMQTNGAARFRNIRIKELASSAPAASTTSKLPTIGADLLDVPDVLGNKPLSLQASSPPAADDAVGKRLGEIEAQFRAARDREAGKTVELDIAALAKSYLTNGLGNAIRDAQRREARAEVAVLEMERDAFLATNVVGPADENVPHEAVRQLRKMYWDTRAKYEAGRNSLPVPAVLYQGYLSELKKALGDFSGADRERVMRLYLEITKRAGFTTWATDDMMPQWKRRCGELERPEALRRLGGILEGEKAIDRAFDYLKTKQNPDGSWGSSDQAGNTALALLAYAGRCETPDSVIYGDTIMKGIMYLIETSKKNSESLFSTDIGSPRAAVEHGMATSALGEFYMAARLGSRSLPGMREAFEKGIGVIIKHQMSSGGWAGQDKGTGFRTDIAGGNPFTTAWQCEALNVANLTSLKIDGLRQCREKAEGYLLGLQTAEGGFGIPNGRAGGNPASMTGAVIHSFAANHAGRRREIAKGIRFVREQFTRQPIAWDQAELQSWFFHTYAFFESRGDDWKFWNERAIPLVLKNQNADGHWQRPSELVGGNEYDSTALCVLMLESYYRGARWDDEKKSR